MVVKAEKERDEETAIVPDLVKAEKRREEQISVLTDMVFAEKRRKEESSIVSDLSLFTPGAHIIVSSGRYTHRCVLRKVRPTTQVWHLGHHHK